MTDHADLIAKLRFCARLHPQVGYPENGKMFAAAADALEAAEAEKAAAVEAALREAASTVTAEVERLRAKQGDGGLPTCRRCDADMTRGLVLVQTYRAGEPDFLGDKTASTFSAGGPGRITGCWKCPKCGHSVVDAIEKE